MTLLSDNKMNETILRDMSDGVIVIDVNGVIQFLNLSGAEILEQRSKELAGSSYADFMSDDTDNDDFHQFMLDAIYDKEHIHTGIVAYRTPDSEKMLDMTTSFVFNDDKTERLGISIVFSDVTELEQLTRLRHESSIIFSTLMTFITLYMFIWRAIDNMQLGIHPRHMSLFIEIMAIISMVFVLRTTSLTLDDFNLRLKNPWQEMRPFVLIALFGALLLVMLKLVMLELGIRFFPVGRPFWDWSLVNFSVVIYPITALLQEVLSRCMMQNSLHYIFTGRYKATLSILVSSLIFGAVHIAYGIKYMIAAFLLLVMLGALYEKTRNLWGVSLVHYVLGICVVFLHYTI